MKRDPYDILGLSRQAGEADVKKAFRRVARELHPDVNRHDPKAEEKFKEAGEAYEILSDADRRATYDRYGHEGLRAGGYAPSGQGFGSVADIFDAFFGGGDPFGGGFGGFGGPARGGAVQGGDVAVHAEVSLEQAAAGAKVDVEYDLVAPCRRCRGNGAEPGTPIETCPRCEGTGHVRRVSRSAFGQVVRAQLCDACGGDGKAAREPCEECSGRGREVRRERLSVDVPAGIADGQRIRLSGRGHAGERGGPSGDLYVVVQVRDDERFLRDGDDLVTVLEVPFPDAALGTRMSVPTLDGEEEVEVPAGTQPGTVLTLRGKGMPSLRTGRRGDQRVVVNVVTPRRLSARQRELLRELADSVGEDNLRDSRDDESLFARVRRAFG